MGKSKRILSIIIWKKLIEPFCIHTPWIALFPSTIHDFIKSVKQPMKLWGNMQSAIWQSIWCEQLTWSPENWINFLIMCRGLLERSVITKWTSSTVSDHRDRQTIHQIVVLFITQMYSVTCFNWTLFKNMYFLLISQNDKYKNLNIKINKMLWKQWSSSC